MRTYKSILAAGAATAVLAGAAHGADAADGARPTPVLTTSTNDAAGPVTLHPLLRDATVRAPRAQPVVLASAQTRDTASPMSGRLLGASDGGGSYSHGASGWSAVIEAALGLSSVDAEGGFSESSVDLDDENYPLISGAARVRAPLGDSNWAFQGDLDGFATFTDRDNGEDNLQTFFAASGHLIYHSPSDRYATGAMLQLGSVNGGEDENANIALIAAEGQYYWDQFTGFGQLGFFVADDENELDVMTDATFIRGGARYYHNDNLRFQGELSYATGEENDPVGADIDAYSWAARVDRKFDDSPLALFAEYRGVMVENDLALEDVTEHTILFGASVQFGVDTIKDADRDGPGFSAPDVGRWTGYTLGVVDN